MKYFALHFQLRESPEPAVTSKSGILLPFAAFRQIAHGRLPLRVRSGQRNPPWLSLSAAPTAIALAWTAGAGLTD